MMHFTVYCRARVSVLSWDLRVQLDVLFSSNKLFIIIIIIIIIHHWLYTLLRDFMEPCTEISVAKVSRMRKANAELAYLSIFCIYYVTAVSANSLFDYYCYIVCNYLFANGQK